MNKVCSTCKEKVYYSLKRKIFKIMSLKLSYKFVLEISQFIDVFQ